MVGMAEEVRISAAAIAAIEIDGKFLLCLNRRGSADAKIGKYAPFGGALEFHKKSEAFLKSIGAKGFESGNDIRFVIPAESLPEFDRWFRRQEGRELTPLRELQEEMVDEERVLGVLPPEAVEMKRAGLFVEAGGSSGYQQAGVETKRYFEVWAVRLSPECEGELRKELAKPDTRLVLVGEKEISEGRAASGVPISDNCRFLVHAKAPEERRDRVRIR